MSGSGSSNVDEFGRAVAKIGVAQLCEGIGFHAIQRSAAETLVDIALRYISDLAKGSHFYANLAGRTECNAHDVIMAMEDVGTGNSSATDTNRSLSNSRTLQDLMRYVEYSEEIPFSKPVPRFPVVKNRAATPSFAQLGETPPFAHIPAWLPAFPDPHTYKSTPVWEERKSDPRIDKLELARQRRKAERSLVSLHVRLSSGMAAMKNSTALPSTLGFAGSALHSNAALVTRQPFGASSSAGMAGAVVPSLSPALRQQWPLDGEQAALLSKLESEGKGKGKRVAALQNPFLASPFSAGEKEVSLITFPGQVHDPGVQTAETGRNSAVPSVMETFASALESAKFGLETTDTDKGGLASSIPEFRDRRPVMMSFDSARKARRKALTAQLSIGAFNRSPTRDKVKSVSLGKEEEKDDRKKRAEQILSQSYLEGVDDASQP